MTNREVAGQIVANICNALNLLPDKEDWKKLIDFTEHQIDKQCAAQQQADKVPSWLCVCGRTYSNVTVGFSCPCGAVITQNQI